MILSQRVSIPAGKQPCQLYDKGSVLKNCLQDWNFGDSDMLELNAGDDNCRAGQGAANSSYFG